MIATELRAAQAREQAVEAEREFERVQGERASHEEELKRCAEGYKGESGVCYWIDHWCWTYDPRLLNKKADPTDKDRAGAYTRFRLRPKQREFLIWYEKHEDADEECLCDKSRDEGLSYLVMMFFLHRWLFRKGWKGTVTSYDADRVDKIDDPDCLFEKARIVLRRLPVWMLPQGFSWNNHDLFCRLVNPESGSVITGDSGKNTGRAGRSSAYFVDEAAFLAEPAKVEAGLSGNTNFVLWGSTVSQTGMGNFFAQKRFNDQLREDQKFTMHYRDNPAKSPEWISKKKASMDPLTWELEYEINYTASVEGICIPAAWVKSAQRLRAVEPRLKDPKRLVRWSRKRVAGLDVGAGKAFSIYIDRAGPLLGEPQKRTDPNTTGTAHWALDLARKRGAYALNYDAPGVGVGVTSAFSDKDCTTGVVITAENTGLPPSDLEWPDGRTSADMFLNIRAEGWWLGRCRFERTHEHVLFLDWVALRQTDPNAPRPEAAVDHSDELDDLIALGKDKEAMTLAAQLSLPKYTKNERGKIQIESKEKMRERGIPSPDHADAAILSLLEPLDVEAAAIFKRPWFRLWPNGKPLPDFHYVVISVRTSFDDEPGSPHHGTGPANVGVYGVFNVASQFDERERKALLMPDGQRYGALLCDFWSERLAFGEVLERIREASRTRWGGAAPAIKPGERPMVNPQQNAAVPGRRPDLVVVEEGGIDTFSLVKALTDWKVPAWPFGSEFSRTMRAHQSSLIVEQGGFFVPESSIEHRKGKPRDWAETAVRAACTFTGEGSISNPGAVEQMVNALLHLQYRDTIKAEPRRAAYPDPDERKERDEHEAEDIHRKEKRKSFYGS